MHHLPDTNGLAILDAALAYADAGIPIAPFDPSKDKGKSCGNILGTKSAREHLGLPDGGRWYDYATTNRATLIRWHSALGGFEAIATSPGRFGAVVADIDTPALFPAHLRDIAKSTAHVITRGTRRGHYWFSHPLPVGNASHPWGELRSIGGGIVLPPYPNDKRHVAKLGALLDLPTELIAGAGVVGEPINLDDFCARYTANRYPQKLEALVRLHDYHASRTNAHHAMLKTLRTGLCEAVVGFVPARTAIDTLRKHWHRSPREFYSLAVWCAGVAERSDRAVIEAMSRRGKGTDSRQYAHKLK